MPTEEEAGSDTDSFMREVASAPAVPIHNPTGETFGRYRILSLLGKGGMGRVYEADDLELGRRVAIKFLPIAFAQRADNVMRFVRERAVTAGLEHPAIVPVYDSGVWPSGEPFYVMRQVRGQPLDRRLRAARTLEERLSLLGSVIASADAVAFAHSRGVVHRDLKPANILVGSFGETFVADWGIAKRLHDPDTADEMSPVMASPDVLDTQLGSVLGTPGYMAPEQARGQGVDERVDVYALGAILHELLVGRGPSPWSEDAAVDHLSPARIAANAPSAPSDLVAIAAKSLSRAPGDRYANASELAKELHRFQTGQLIGARRYSWAELTRRWLARHRAAAIVALAMGTIVLAGGLVSVRRIVRERDTAQTERAAADAARREATERNQALVLLQARAELTRDPTASLAWLKRYPPTAGGWSEGTRIATDAVSRGVARTVWTLNRPLGSVAFTPDGRTVAAGSDDGTLTLLDVATEAQRAYREPDGVGKRIVFTPDGARAATTDGRTAVRIWDLAAGTSVRLPGENIGNIGFSPDGSMLFGRRSGGFTRLWRVATGEPIDLPCGGDALIAFATRPGTIYCARGSTLEHIELIPRRVLAHVQLEHAPFDLQASGDGRWLAASLIDKLTLWNPTTNALRTISVGKDAVRLVTASGDGRFFVTCGWSLPLGLWLFDVESATPRLLTTGERCTRQGFSFSSDGTQFVSAVRGGGVAIHDPLLPRVRTLLGHDTAIGDASFSPDGSLLASVSTDGAVRLWPLERVTRLEQDPMERIAAGTRVLLAIPDGGVDVLDADTGVRVHASGPRPKRWAGRGTISGDGRVAAFPDATGTLVIFDVARREGHLLGKYDEGAAVVAEQLSSDGATLALSDENGGVRVVDVATGTSRPLGRMSDRISAMAVSRGARRVAACGRDGTVHVWDLSTGAEHVPLRTGALLWFVGFSLDGSEVAAAGGDGIVYRADVAGERVTRLAGHVGSVSSVDFFADGRLVSSGSDGTVRVWNPGPSDGFVVRREQLFEARLSYDETVMMSRATGGSWISKTDRMPPTSAETLPFIDWIRSQTSAQVDAKGRLSSTP